MSGTPEMNVQGLRRFGLTLAAAIATVFGVLLPLFTGVWPVWPWLATAIFASWALAAPGTLRPVFRAWMAFGEAMNFVMTRLILGSVYYAAVVPTGLVLRLLGKDPMRRRSDSDNPTYRIASPARDPKQMEKPF